MKIEFVDLDLESGGDECYDSLEVRFHLIGQPGIRFVGILVYLTCTWFSTIQTASGDFGTEYPDFTWQEDVSATDLDNLSWNTEDYSQSQKTIRCNARIQSLPQEAMYSSRKSFLWNLRLQCQS